MFKLLINNKEKLFDYLCDNVKHCRLCERMTNSPKVLSNDNGNIYTKTLFIGEAPGRLGADRTGIPFLGDRTGLNFQNLLNNARIKREDIFITNALLCNPKNGNNNDTPDLIEIKNCSIYLKILIDLINPKYIITLGEKALLSLNEIFPHTYKLKENVRKLHSWYNRKLIPLYHPGPRSLVHRNFYKQVRDFYFIKHQMNINPKKWNKINSLSYKIDSELTNGFGITKLQKVIVNVLKQKPMTEFILTKFLYLIDWESYKSRQKIITDSLFLNSINGPFLPSLKKDLEYLRKYININKWKSAKFMEINNSINLNRYNLNSEELNIIKQVFDQNITKKSAQLKTKVYLTTPMKKMLKREKAGKMAYNKPIEFDNNPLGKKVNV